MVQKQQPGDPEHQAEVDLALDSFFQETRKDVLALCTDLNNLENQGLASISRRPGSQYDESGTFAVTYTFAPRCTQDLRYPIDALFANTFQYPLITSATQDTNGYSRPELSIVMDSKTIAVSIDISNSTRLHILISKESKFVRLATENRHINYLLGHGAQIPPKLLHGALDTMVFYEIDEENARRRVSKFLRRVWKHTTGNRRIPN